MKFFVIRRFEAVMGCSDFFGKKKIRSKRKKEENIVERVFFY